MIDRLRRERVQKVMAVGAAGVRLHEASLGRAFDRPWPTEHERTALAVLRMTLADLDQAEETLRLAERRQAA